MKLLALRGGLEYNIIKMKRLHFLLVVTVREVSPGAVLKGKSAETIFNLLLKMVGS